MSWKVFWIIFLFGPDIKKISDKLVCKKELTQKENSFFREIFFVLLIGELGKIHQN